MQRAYSSAGISWVNPFIKLGLYKPDAERTEEANNYIPLEDFVPFDYVIAENKSFGDFFLFLAHSEHVPMCELCAWMHMTGERITSIIEGKAPAPNVEQLAIARIMLNISEVDFNILIRLAISSWVASGLNPYEQIEPQKSIFTTKTSKRKAVTQKKVKTATRVTDKMPQSSNQKANAGSKTATVVSASVLQSKEEEHNAMPILQTTIQKGTTETSKKTDGIQQPKVKLKEKVKITVPNLRMKVKVDSSVSEDTTIIRTVFAGIGDSIRIDEVRTVDRDLNDVVHYGCRSGKHRIDLFMDHGTWYMDASMLAASSF